jgi:hypothetical protein
MSMLRQSSRSKDLSTSAVAAVDAAEQLVVASSSFERTGSLERRAEYEYKLKT